MDSSREKGVKEGELWAWGLSVKGLKPLALSFICMALRKSL